MSVNSSNIETWKEVLLALQSMFDDKLDLETIHKFFDENEQEIERTVDAILVHLTTKAVNGESIVEKEEEPQETETDTSDDEDSFEKEFEHIGNVEEEEDSSDSDSEEEIEEEEQVVENSQVSITQEFDNSTSSIEIPSLNEQNPTIDLGLSEISADVSLAQSQDQHYVQVESLIDSEVIRESSSDSPQSPLQDQIDQLTLKLSEVTTANRRIEEEKKHAMKWCLNEMQQLREEVKIKEEEINKQQQEIDSLRKQLQDKNANKLDKFITESKQMLTEGVQSLSEQINAGVNRVQSEFKDNEKDWIFVDRLKEFASEFKKELLELFKDPLPKNPFTLTKKTTVVTQKSEQEQDDEERELWKTEKESLESYVKELENRIRMYQEEEKLRNQSEENSQSVGTSTSESQSTNYSDDFDNNNLNNNNNNVNNNNYNNNNNNNNYYGQQQQQQQQQNQGYSHVAQPPMFAWPLQYNPWSGVPPQNNQINRYFVPNPIWRGNQQQ